MKAITKLIFLNDKDEKFFGDGPYKLLRKVEETGSLHAAANEMGMAYSKATKLLKNAEASLGFALTVRKIGGKCGGGSVLTDEAKDFMKRYENYHKECVLCNEEIYEKHFGTRQKRKPVYGCVIMASGLGKRFGGDKLMVNLFGRPLISYVIDATQGLFSYRVVVTRNEQVRDYCKDRGIWVVYHSMPNRNDTIRLGLTELLKQSTKELSGCVFCPADMPFIGRDSLREMLFFAAKKKDGILRMTFNEKEGAPVLFSNLYFDELMHLPEGKGGNVIIKAHPEKIMQVKAMEEYELWDIDTKEDFEKIKCKMKEIFEK